MWVTGEVGGPLGVQRADAPWEEVGEDGERDPHVR